MDIVATDLLGLLVAGVFAAVLTALVALAQHARAKTRPPDCYGGIWTPEQATDFIRMKAQYGAKLDDLAQPDSDEDTQMSAW